MTFEEFKSSLKEESPPDGIDKTLAALWYDVKGIWDKAHRVAQGINNTTGSWIHAYLHRKEGDSSNAAYWYSKAGKSFPDMSLQEEWETIVKELLKEV